MIKILIIDDDVEMCRLLQKYLMNESFEVEFCHKGQEGLKKALEHTFQLIVLDVMMPGIDGLEVLRRLREVKNTPVLMLTAKDGELDKVIGLDDGADDYLTKPFSLSEFSARVKSLIRRYTKLGCMEDNERLLVYGTLCIDPVKVQTIRGSKRIDLTAKEFELLYFLARHPSQVFTKKQIYQNVWGNAYAYDDNNIMVHIRRLRKKLEDTPERPTYIQTVWGIGYRFNGELEDVY